MLPRQGKAEGVHNHKAIIILDVKGSYLKTKKIKTMNIKMAIIHNYQQLNLKNKLSKLVEQKQNHRYGDHLDGYQLGEVSGRIGKQYTD